VDEKIPYSLDDLEAMPMAGCIAYAGKGFSAGVLHMLRASTRAAYCLPVADQGETTADTKELDHLLAMHFGWWDVFVGKKKPVSTPAATLFQVAVSVCVANAGVSAQSPAPTAYWPGVAWRTATPESQGLDSKAPALAAAEGRGEA